MCPSLTRGLKFLKTMRPLHLYPSPPKRPRLAHYIKRQGRKKFWGVRISGKETPPWVWGRVVSGLISFWEGSCRSLQGAFLPFREESGVELAAEVEEPSTFLGAREATTAERGKGRHSEGERRGWEPRSRRTLRPSLWERIGEESPAIQNSR